MMSKVILVWLVLSIVPVYLLSHTIVPRFLLASIEQLLRDFLWGSHLGKARVHLLFWEVVCLLISEGGLGIHSL